VTYSADEAPRIEVRRALVLHERQVVIDLIELTLNHGLFVVRAAGTVADVETMMTTWHPHMIVVDMDHVEAADFVQRLGASDNTRRSVTPILGLTRRGDLQTKLKAFALGVDDILTVPFAPEELLARTLAMTRRATGIDRPIIPTIQIGDVHIDILNRQVYFGESSISLSVLEQSLLYLLASRAGQVVTREEILDIIWGFDYVAESNIVDRHIRNLRMKLHDLYRSPRFIATVPGQGYQFIPTFSNRGWDGDQAGTGPPSKHVSARRS
jgi:DNA-binding response OmpR family regulator